MGRLNDISLAAQVSLFGNKRAFDQLVRENQSAVRRFFLSQTLGDEMLSDDLSQDTFIKAYTHISQYSGRSSFLTWLTRIAYNVWYDHCRSLKPEVRSDDGEVKAEPVYVRSEESPSLKTDLYRALDVLRPEERACITLQLVDGYSIDEIAGIVSIPTGTVKSHLKRGKEKMANYLRKNGYD